MGGGEARTKEHARAAAWPRGYGEYLQPARVSDCYLGILLDQPLPKILPEPGRVLVVAPAALLYRQIPQSDGQVLYDLVTGHPDRVPQELVFLRARRIAAARCRVERVGDRL